MDTKEPQNVDPEIAWLQDDVEQRTRALQTLADVTRAVNEAESATEALAAVLRILVDRSGWEAGHAWLVVADRHLAVASSGAWQSSPDANDGALRTATVSSRHLPGDHGFLGEVLSGREALRRDIHEGFEDERAALLEELGVRAVLGCAVRVGERPVAVLEFFGRAPNRLEPFVRKILPDACIQLGHAIERQDLERRIATGADRERQTLAQELHDGLGQRISALAMVATTLQRQLQARESPESDAAARLVRGLNDAQKEIRALTQGLLPVQIDGDGLMHALRDLAGATDPAYPDVRLVFECPEPVGLEDDFVATQLYRIAQEAMNNALRHGEATRVTLRLEGYEPLQLTIRDDGRGLPDPMPVAGSGLRIMRHRAGLIGGRLSLESEPGHGTTVRVSVSGTRSTARR